MITVKNSVKELHEQYVNAEPFPHIVIDNFLPESILNLVEKEVKVHPDWYWDDSEYVEGYQVKKFYTPSPLNHQFERSMIELKMRSPFTMHVLEYFHSKEVLEFLETLTGIQNLVVDTDWLGGGLHKTLNGGKLAVHADFNIHWKMYAHRRINLLLYLNRDWLDEYNGELELWTRTMSHCVKKIKPVFNRAVIFNITDDAYHGHPVPLNTPDDIARLSLALYYYTKDRPEHEKAPGHPVLWKDT